MLGVDGVLVLGVVVLVVGFSVVVVLDEGLLVDGLLLVVGVLVVLSLLLVVGVLVSVFVGVLLLGVSVSLELSSVVSVSLVCVSLVSVLSVSVCVVLVSGSEVVSFSLLQATRAKTRVNANSSAKIFFIFLSSKNKKVRQPKSPHRKMRNSNCRQTNYKLRIFIQQPAGICIFTKFIKLLYA